MAISITDLFKAALFVALVSLTFDSISGELLMQDMASGIDHAAGFHLLK